MTSGPPEVLDGWFRAAAARHPDAPALRIRSQRWTYAELDRLATAWAAALTADGRRPRRVGLLAAKSLEAYAGFLAGLYAGATVVPLSPDAPGERNAGIVAAAELDALVVDTAGAAELDEIAAARPDAPLLVPGDVEVSAALRPRVIVPGDGGGEPTTAARSTDDFAYLLFTSGSTGQPKGVPISHANFSAYLTAMLPRYDVGPGDNVTQVYELTFDLSMFEVWIAWSTGACLCAMNRLQALQPARYARTYDLTVWVSTPSLVNSLKAKDLLAPEALPGLRYSVFCGEPLPGHSAWYWQDAAPNAVLDNLYGPTELTVSCTGLRCPPGEAAPVASNGTVPVGWANDDMEYRLVPTDGTDAAESAGDVGSTDVPDGELCFTGPQMFRGYLDPADDQGRFIELDGRTWYRTGDRAQRSDEHGLLHLGRTDNQVKVQGYRIELAEVEHTIRSEVPGADAVACAVDDAAAAVLVAFVIASDPVDLAALALRLADRLPAYMLPKRLWQLSDAPLNRNGKVDRSGLRDTAARWVRESAQPEVVWHSPADPAPDDEACRRGR